MVFNHLSEKYEGNGGTALAMMEKNSHYKIKMYSSLAQDIADTIGVKLVNKNQIQAILNDAIHHNKRCCIIPNASVVV